MESIPTLGLADKKRCPKCESTTFRLYKFRKGSTWVVECTSCGCAFKAEVADVQVLDSFEFTPAKGEEDV
jgi:uncharacterized Zn finger protein